jgi:hypothetical protein
MKVYLGGMSILSILLTLESGCHSDKLHFLPIRGTQLDAHLGTIDQCLVLTQPVHTKTDINALDSKTIRLATKSTPLILRFTFEHSCLAGISPPRILTII